MTDQIITIDEETTESDLVGAAEDGPAEATPSRWKRRPLIIGGAIAGVIALLLVIANLGAGSETADAGAAELTVADVVVTDLTQVVTFEATLGSTDDDPVATQISGTVTGIAEPGTTVALGEPMFSVDGEPVVLLHGEQPMYRDLTIGQDTIDITPKLNGTITWVAAPGTVVEQGDVLFEVDGQPVVLLYGTEPAYRRLFDAPTNLTGDDVLQLETALVALGYDPDGSLDVDGEFTSGTRGIVEAWQEDLGAEVDGSVDFGEIVFLPGPAQVISVSTALGGNASSNAAAMTVSSGEAASGPDVLQLEASLEALGFDADGGLVVDGIYDSATREAVLTFQENSGLTPDGVLHLGEVVFLPDDVRVTGQLVSESSQVGAGNTVMSVSSPEKVVRLDLPADQQGLVAPGSAVTVKLPDFTEIAGTVVSVPQTATRSNDGPATFQVLIALDDPSQAGDLDEAPVDVIIESDSVESVIAVPVSALVALLEGGYAVEVPNEDGTRSLVAVEVGFFADGMVEITAGALEAGDQVLVP